ncbi:MAG: hypothetical protein IIA58_03900 [Candidatus Marinimicrobia bacterium]|nr:hypothetical protein [Candidatus Neomarinimicrobiota bacterium]
MRAIVYQKYGPPDVLQLKELKEIFMTGKIKSVIDRRYPLEHNNKRVLR